MVAQYAQVDKRVKTSKRPIISRYSNYCIFFLSLELNRAQILTEFGSGRESEHLNVKAKNMRNLIERVQRFAKILIYNQIFWAIFLLFLPKFYLAVIN